MATPARPQYFFQHQLLAPLDALDSVQAAQRAGGRAAASKAAAAASEALGAGGARAPMVPQQPTVLEYCQARIPQLCVMAMACFGKGQHTSRAGITARRSRAQQNEPPAPPCLQVLGALTGDGEGPCTPEATQLASLLLLLASRAAQHAQSLASNVPRRALSVAGLAAHPRS